MRVRRTTLAAAAIAAVLCALALVACEPSTDGSSTPITTDPATTSSSSTSASTSSSTSTTTTTAPWPRSPVTPLPARGSAPVLSRIDTADPVIFLTLDDGMVRDPRALELVEQFRIPVAVFLNEGPMRADPDYFRRITAFDGSINSHTRSHPNLTKVSSSTMRNEMCGMRNVIGEYVLQSGHLFRSPFGVTNGAVQSMATSCGMNAVLFWRVALNDGRVQYQQGHELQRGDIVLGHFRDDLYDNLRALWWQAASQGLTIAPIDAYLPLP